MTKHRSTLYMLLGVLAIGNAGLAVGDDDDDHEGHARQSWSEHRGHRDSGDGDGWFRARSDLAPVTNTTYNKECGSCHMAYQPGLLPPRAWAQIMSPAGLKNHYGDDASLSEELRQEISGVLGADAANLALQADTAGQTANGSTAAESLPRISATSYFTREHDEIPLRLVKDNPEVGSFSKCNACHRRAPEGDYNERNIDIPGYGRWRD